MVHKMLLKVLAIVVLVSSIGQAYEWVNPYCNSDTCRNHASEVLWRMDMSTNPCDNFYLFACGDWIKYTELEEGQDKESQKSLVSKNIAKQVKDAVDYEAQWPEEPFETDELLRTYFKACTNMTARDEAGIQPAKNLLETLGGWPVISSPPTLGNYSTWYNYVVDLIGLGLEEKYILAHFVKPDFNDPTRYKIYVDYPKFGIKRDSLVKGRGNPDVEAYYTYMVETAKFFGASYEEAQVQMENALNFEITLANSSADISTEPEERYLEVPLGQFPKYPGLPSNLTEYLNEVFNASSADAVKVTDTDTIYTLDNADFFGNLSQLLETSDSLTQSNYLGWRVIQSLMPKLDSKARNITHNFKVAIKGPRKAKPTWKSCVKELGVEPPKKPAPKPDVDPTEKKPEPPGDKPMPKFLKKKSLLEAATSSLYIRKYFSPAEKRTASTIFPKLKEAMKMALKEIDFKDSGTKEKAIVQLKYMRQITAYPDELLNSTKIEEMYEGLYFDNYNYLKNVRNMRRYMTKKMDLKLYKRRDPSNWKINLKVLKAKIGYDDVNNILVTPAGLLQEVFFNKYLPIYFNYGAIGSKMGQKMAHAILKKDNSTIERVTKAMSYNQCLYNQFFGGANSGLRAYKNYIRKETEDAGGFVSGFGIPYTTNKTELVKSGYPFPSYNLFWISYAQTMCTKYSDAKVAMNKMANSSLPAEEKVNTLLQNNKPFLKIFKCPYGSNMNPYDRCKPSKAT